jgi:hypothetical protein
MAIPSGIVLEEEKKLLASSPAPIFWQRWSGVGNFPLIFSPATRSLGLDVQPPDLCKEMPYRLQLR